MPVLAPRVFYLYMKKSRKEEASVQTKYLNKYLVLSTIYALLFLGIWEPGIEADRPWHKPAFLKLYMS